MNPLQDIDLQGSPITMVAPGLPVVSSTRPVAIPLINNPAYAMTTTTNIIDTVSKITKEIGEIFKTVPYIKAFAGILIQIIKVREVRKLAGERYSNIDDKTGNPNSEGSSKGTD